MKKEEDTLYDLITIVIIKSVYKIFLIYHAIFREEKRKALLSGETEEDSYVCNHLELASAPR